MICGGCPLCDVCPSCFTFILLASVTTAITTALVVTNFFILILVAVRRYHSTKPLPLGKEVKTSAETLKGMSANGHLAKMSTEDREQLKCESGELLTSSTRNDFAKGDEQLVKRHQLETGNSPMSSTEVSPPAPDTSNEKWFRKISLPEAFSHPDKLLIKGDSDFQPAKNLQQTSLPHSLFPNASSGLKLVGDTQHTVHESVSDPIMPVFGKGKKRSRH